MFRIELIKPDGAKNYINLVDIDNSIKKDNIDEHLLLFENYFYQLIIQSDETFENIELFIGDYAIPLSINEINGCYQTSKTLLFEGCYDLVDITLCILDSQNNENVMKSSYVRVATTKETATQIQLMLEEIENNLPNFLDICFSKSKKKSGILNDKPRTIWNTIKLLDEIITTYQRNFANFCNYKKSKVIDEPMLVDIRSMRHIDEESLRWIVMNPEYLIPTNFDKGISIARKKYLPSKVSTSGKKYSYEIYENQIILGFLKEIITYVNYQITELENELKKISLISNEIIAQLPNTHELTGRCVFIFYKGIIQRLQDKTKILSELYYKYSRILKCTSLVINKIPKSTNTFRQIRHYRCCYECIAKWYEMGDYTLEHLDYLFKLKTLSRIFEYFCLIKIQNAIERNEYVFQFAERIGKTDEKCNEENINNMYLFSNGKHYARLYYEPIIHTHELYSNINLFSTGYNFGKSCWNEYWTPDFVIEIESDEKKYYFIIDAKFSTFQNVKKRYIPDLVLKYGTQIASKDKFFSDIIGIGAIYPNDGSKLYYFKRESNITIRKSLPIYFSMSIEKGEEGDVALSSQIRKIFETVNIVEKDLVKVDNRNFYGKSTEYATPNIEKSKNNNVVRKSNNISGRGCQYYNKGICLIQKNMCTAKNESCLNYIRKNDNDLERENIDCKNLNIKSKNITCSISGRKGCIGINKCKFYKCRRNNN